ncbi:hypothetical protein CYMTET_13401 [Cymbomonas tetramitiformis]|uniref:Uncharacterized protein n=1 Tax=Cymbomonas tetramitiformis TaxID=36881 RepID=A0AAE0LAX0_9CHLO|nr:hypothetical protein CYMTET_13401 [Cymbomonas tetramitiformis]
MWLELEVLETRYQTNREETECLQERIDRTSMELGRMRAVLGIIFATQMRLAHSMLPLLRSYLDVLYCFSVDGDYELCLRPDLGEEDLLSAHRIFDEFRRASQAKSETLRKEDDFWWEHKEKRRGGLDLAEETMADASQAIEKQKKEEWSPSHKSQFFFDLSAAAYSMAQECSDRSAKAQSANRPAAKTAAPDGSVWGSAQFPHHVEDQ